MMRQFDHPAKTPTKGANTSKGGPQTRDVPKKGSGPTSGSKMNPMKAPTKAC